MQPPTFDAYATLGEQFFLARGEDAVIAAVLSAVGVAGKVASWRFVAGRSHYFGSYRENAQEWREAWDLAFRITAVVEDPHHFPPVPSWGYFEFSTIDRTYFSHGSPEDDASWPCLVVADFLDEQQLDAARRATRDLAGTSQVTIGRGFGRYPQLRIELGDRPREFYEEGAGEAERLLAALVAHGASVRYLDTRLWLAHGR